MTALTTPPLADGETYIGACGDAQGGLYHLILLPGDNGDNEWQQALDRAKSIGGDLPNRIEQAILWANHRDQFQKEGYWSNETHHSESAYAWYQCFNDGCQDYDHKDYYYRAIAVRRLVIEP